ncbi:MAG: NifB/NifX family molybdenum-iron cluster-binding protein [Bacteroidales bacterium]|nr:NifB/NifX family molybdenum-iron cluster-binding protein [Bacteroidales bacterium]MCF8344292.1 NifB/NifX family molybdenum-iron cluster-binding protein [Bacteroidales bacterium]MCF8351896.1 NifB/NifX family molybdenum-iron cluster-binding protein [Bacteroidales bacterium]MCF8377332.1 NifB/NifX family molybdenum-iron cluster-binding protein [Bacteroidales bacterium]MCF8401922.1 NifB/NifX family molybdenum-iron cluster-binding protein [Bacteroidales bacterium]
MNQLKIAVPTYNGALTAHFGHCEKFALIGVEDEKIVTEEFITPPVHQPGVYPKFLAEQGVHVIIAGGMGQRAQQLFQQNNIRVCVGVNNGSPRQLVEDYLKNRLATGQNLCDH